MGVHGHVVHVQRGWHRGAVAAHRLRGAAVQCRAGSRAAHPHDESVNRVPSMFTSIARRFMLALSLFLL